MKVQVNEIFRKSNAKNVKGFIRSNKFFIVDDNSGENSCSTAYHFMTLCRSNAAAAPKYNPIE